MEEAALALQGEALASDLLTADASSASRITASTLHTDASGWLAAHLPGAPPSSQMSIFAIVCRAHGAVEIFALPDVTRVWAADDVIELPATLIARDDLSSTVTGTAR